MLVGIEAINFGGKRILRSSTTALFLVVIFVQLHVTLSHLSILLTAQVEDLCGKAFFSNRSYQVERSVQRMLNYPKYRTDDSPQNS